MAQNERPASSTTSPIVCTLDEPAAAHQLLEWDDLQHRATSSRRIAGGVRMTFPAELEADIVDLVDRERQCCAFLDIETRTDGDLVTLEISSQNPDALPVIEIFAGITTR